HPAGEDLLERAVDDRRREPRVELAAERTLCLPALDDALDRRQHRAEVLAMARALRAPRDLPHEHAHEVRLPAPRAQQDRRDLAELLARLRLGLLHLADRREQVGPRLAE